MTRERRRGRWLLGCCSALAAASIVGALPTDKIASVGLQGGTAISKTRDGYVSLNLEFFPETFPVLSNPKVRFLMSQLRPAYLRIGGNSADNTAYNFSGSGSACSSQYNMYFCFGPDELQALSDFAKAINWQVIFNLNEYYPYPDPVHDPDAGPRTPRPGPYVQTNTQPLLEYMAASGLEPAFITLGNELTDNLSPSITAHDYATLAQLVDKTWASKPDSKPTLIGPDCFWQNRTWVEHFLAEPKLPPLGALTWHLYLLNRTAEVERILNPVILDTARHWAKEYRAAIANSSRPTLESWITETGVAWGGDLHTVADAFSGGFWFLDQLGMLAQEGVVVQHRHTVYAYNIQWASSFLGTPEQNFEPRPDYWTSLLWGRLVGTTVLNVTRSLNSPMDPFLRVYAHCSVSPGGVTLVVINLSKEVTYHLTITEDAGFQGTLDDKQAYFFTADSFTSGSVYMNGEPLSLSQIDEDNFAFSGLQPLALTGDVVSITPLTYGFVVLPDAEPLACGPASSQP